MSLDTLGELAAMLDKLKKAGLEDSEEYERIADEHDAIAMCMLPVWDDDEDDGSVA